MKRDVDNTKRKRPIKKIILFSFLSIILVAGISLYNNFNHLLANALLRTFDSNIISDVYELKFEKLSVNPFEGTIRVFNATLLPREKPLNNYPYINGTFRLKTEKLTLKKVDLIALLNESRLILERITILKPDIELSLTEDRHILVPFKDSTAAASQEAVGKKSIDSFLLNEFQLVDASFHVTNSKKQRTFSIAEFNISLYDLLIQQQTRRNRISLKHADLSLGQFEGSLQKGPVKHIHFKEFTIGMDSLEAQMSLDTLIFHFRDFNTDLKALDVQTADSIFHVTLQSFHLSYQDKIIELSDMSFKPNVSKAALQRKYAFQHADFSGTVGTLKLIQVNFDSLIYKRKIFIDQIVVDKVSATIFKDKTKPIDSSRAPAYLGQYVKTIPIPLLIKQLKATNINLVSTEKKSDSSYAKVKIQRGTVDVKNLTNLTSKKMLTINADAYLENKAHFNVDLKFGYSIPQFSFSGVVKKFSLPELNGLLQAFTPAKINAGTLDEITFSGIAERTNANGTMKFLYHDLKVDLELDNTAKWKSSVIAFAANSVLKSSNPASSNSPPRIVQFHVERDMNKGFINIILKSVINGLKETMFMSKENRKTFHAAKKKMKNK